MLDEENDSASPIAGKSNDEVKKELDEKDILNGKRNDLEYIFEKYINLGLTKSLVSILLLVVLTENNERIAIYERAQFQLKLDSLMKKKVK